jgi:tetratricopeptide (TPR) repeat protein
LASLSSRLALPLKAIEWAQKGLDNEPSASAARAFHAQLASANETIGDLEHAEAQYRILVDLANQAGAQEQTAAAAAAVARILCERGLTSEALAAAADALAMPGGETVSARVQLGRILFALGRFDEARAEWEGCLSAESSGAQNPISATASSTINLLLSRLSAETGDFAAALAYHARALDVIVPKTADASYANALYTFIMSRGLSRSGDLQRTTAQARKEVAMRIVSFCREFSSEKTSPARFKKAALLLLRAAAEVSSAEAGVYVREWLATQKLTPLERVDFHVYSGDWAHRLGCFVSARDEYEAAIRTGIGCFMSDRARERLRAAFPVRKLSAEEMQVARDAGFDDAMVEWVHSRTQGDLKVHEFDGMGGFENERPPALLFGLAGIVFDRHEELVRRLRPALRDRGYELVLESPGLSFRADEACAVTVVRTTDKWDIVRGSGAFAAGCNYDIGEEQIFSTLREWDRRFAIEFLRATHDCLLLEFERVPEDLDSFLHEVVAFCPTVAEGVNSADELRKYMTQLRDTRTLSLWWD